MDVKIIFIASQRYKGTIQWVFTDGSEWHYIGVADDYHESKADTLIKRHFGAAELYLILDRHRVEVCHSEVAAVTIKPLFEKEDLTISNKDFTKMMVFGRIGIVKYGSRELPLP